MKFYWSLRKLMKLCLAQLKPFPGYSFYFLLFLLLLLSVYVNQRHTSLTLHVLFPLDFPPLLYNASLLPASQISCLVGYDVIGRRGLVLREGNVLPGRSYTKTTVSEPALCPSAPPTYILVPHKKAPKTHFRPPDRVNGVATLRKKMIR